MEERLKKALDAFLDETQTCFNAGRDELDSLSQLKENIRVKPNLRTKIQIEEVDDGFGPIADIIVKLNDEKSVAIQVHFIPSHSNMV
jgi:hypothetical protein